MEKIDYVFDDSEKRPYGDTYRIEFAVTETIRGPKFKDLTVIMAVQIRQRLIYMRDHGTEILLIGGGHLLDTNMMSTYPLIEEQGKKMSGEVYEFRPLEKIVLKDNQPDEREGNQLNTDFDSGKFFDLNLAVIQGRKEILSHARAFAKKYPSILRGVWMQVPNDFGQLVGYPNAYCGIALPVCDEARRMLEGLKKNPDLIFKHVGPAEQSWWNRKKIIDIASAMLESMKEQK